MKSIKQQYIDLTEGKMSQANFMRNVRMTMPQFVTNVTSFSDTVKILKNKGILSESLATEEEVFSQGAQDENYDQVGTDGYDNVSEENDEDAEFDAILKQLEDEKAGEEEVAAQYDLEEGTLTVKQIVDKFEELLDKNPNTKVDDLAKVLNTTKEELAKIIGIPDLYPAKPAMNENQEPKAVDENIQEVLTGIAIEHECYPDWTYDEVEKLVKKNIKKNPLYYTNYKLTGIRDYEVQTMGNINPDDRKMKFYTEKTAVDKAMGMKKVKMPKKAVKEAMEVSPQGQLQPQGFPTASDVDRILKFMKANKTFVSLLKNLNSTAEFTQFFRELLKLTDPELEALKISDTQLQGMFKKAVLDKRKETGVPAQIFAKNANIQKGINKIGGIKEQLRAMVREILAEEEIPSKKKAAEEITAKAVDAIDDHNEGEGKGYKKKWLEDVFDSYESKVGHRYDDSVFEDVIDRLKAKGYTMTMKETFDGRDNLTDISDDTKD